ncbi:hypothetical protein [Tengunoibacter tsumagoiensis]|nr:hypothetical protein [Tengunoibacter tsumagoiensis]
MHIVLIILLLVAVLLILVGAAIALLTLYALDSAESQHPEHLLEEE